MPQCSLEMLVRPRTSSTMRRAIRTTEAVGARCFLAAGRSESRAVTSGYPSCWTRQLHHPQPFRRLYGSSARGEPGVFSTIHEITPGNTIATVTVSNPSKLNVVNTPILEQFTKVCNGLSKDDSLRCVVLTGGKTAPGKSPSFIGGADIKEMNALSSSSEARTFIRNISSACQSLRSIPVPVIAKIDGFCLGAGLEIAASCDLRIATRNSTCGMPEVKVGIPSVAEAALLPGLIGMGRTRRFLYLAENIDAREAERWGLVEKVVEDEEALEKAVQEWSGVIAEMGQKAMRSQKKLMQKWENCSVEGINAGVDAFAEAFEDGGREPREFMSRFLGRKS